MKAHRTPPIIETAEALKALVEELRGIKLIAVDTEMDCYYHYHDKVCLVQLSSEEADYLIDPLNLDLSPLNEIFNDPSCTAVFHAGSNDVPYLNRDHKLVFNCIFDTYVAAELLGLPSKGLAGLIKMFFDIELDKQYQRADWTIRPLPPEMDHYARYDTCFLLDLRKILLSKLEEANLLMVAERMCSSIVSSRLHQKTFSPDNWIHVKNVRSLPAKSYPVLRSLYIWRDSLARQLDLAPFRVLSDYSLVKLADVAPQTYEEVATFFEKSSHLQVMQENSQSLIEAIVSGIASGPIEWPQEKRKESGRLNEKQVQIFDRLRSWRNKYAAAGKINGVLLTNKMLEALVVQMPKNRHDLEMMAIGSPDLIKEYGTVLLEIVNS
ncbi:MAG: ribonuclease D [Candidatus Bruticola sp.]